MSPAADDLRTGTQAVILAGGLGTRMRPLTETIPKPMIAVAGKPFLEHQLGLLRGAGIMRVLLLVAYLGEQIQEYFGDGSRFGCSISYSFEPSPLGTGGALKNAEAQLQERFLLLNGDTYLAIDYFALVRKFVEMNRSASIVAYEKPPVISQSVPASLLLNNLGVNADRQVTAYRKRNSEGLTHIDAGAIVLKKSVVASLPAAQKRSLEEEVYPELIARGEMLAWITHQPFYDMGSPSGLAALEEKLK